MAVAWPWAIQQYLPDMRVASILVVRKYRHLYASARTPNRFTGIPAAEPDVMNKIQIAQQGASVFADNEAAASSLLHEKNSLNSVM